MGAGFGRLVGRAPALAVALTVAALVPQGCDNPPSFGVPVGAMPLCGAQTPERVIALTFDGGPGPFTETDLRLLARIHAHATFFVTAKRMAGYPDAVRHEVELGMDVENHTWSHPIMTLLTPGAQRAEIVRAQRALVAAGAPAPTLWRPPYGAVDGRTIRLARSLGLRTVLWEHAVEIKVRNPIPDPQARAREIAASIRPGQILLAHDSLPLGTTTETLRYLLPMLQGDGYRVVSVPELQKLGPEVLGHARWGSEVNGHPMLRGGCPMRWPEAKAATKPEFEPAEA